MSGAESLRREREIHRILFPNIAFLAKEHCPEGDHSGRERWRNAKCDVQTMWCHLHYGGTHFATNDQDFLKVSKRTALEALGAGFVGAPSQVLESLGEGE